MFVGGSNDHHQNTSRCTNYRSSQSHNHNHDNFSACGNDRRHCNNLSGRSSPFNNNQRCRCSSGRNGERVGWGREGGVRLDESPLLERRRNSASGLGWTPLRGMGGLTDGLGGMGLGGRGDGPRSPMMPRGGMGPFESPRGSPMVPHMPLSHNPLLEHRIPIQPVMGMGMGMGMTMNPFGSRESLLGGRGLLPGMGSRSRPSSIRSGGRDPIRMPFGPGRGGMGNYRSPYVEDYESEIDEMEREIQLMEFLERDGGMMHPGIYDDYMYRDDLGDMRGRLF